MLERIRIVLVEPAGAANVGAAARAVANMGVGQLVLVSPQCRVDDEQARAFASAAQSHLRAARIAGSLGEALRGCVASFGTTARAGRFRTQHNLVARDAAREAVRRAAAGDVAFAFGPERTGLTSADLLLLDRVVTIPSSPDYPALNVAAAVMIVCYELFLASHAESTPPPRPRDRPAADEARRRMYAALFDALDRVGYFRAPNRPQLQLGLRRLFGRLPMTEFECGLLFGVARQILWYVQNGAAGRSADRLAPEPQRPEEIERA